MEKFPQVFDDKDESTGGYFESAVQKTILDEPFAKTAKLIHGAGVIHYSSDNTAVADVNPTTGKVTIKGVGVAQITATAPATDIYAEASLSYKLTVNKADQTTPLKLQDENGEEFSDTQIVTYGAPDFTLTAEGGNGTGAYSLKSEDSNIAAVSGPSGEGNNTFTVHIAGANPSPGIYLTLSKDGDSQYNAPTEDVEATVKVQVNKKTPTDSDFRLHAAGRFHRRSIRR